MDQPVLVEAAQLDGEAQVLSLELTIRGLAGPLFQMFQRQHFGDGAKRFIALSHQPQQHRHAARPLHMPPARARAAVLEGASEVDASSTSMSRGCAGARPFRQRAGFHGRRRPVQVTVNQPAADFCALGGS
jgi:hypothetical protein